MAVMLKSVEHVPSVLAAVRGRKVPMAVMLKSVEHWQLLVITVPMAARSDGSDAEKR